MKVVYLLPPGFFTSPGDKLWLEGLSIAYNRAIGYQGVFIAWPAAEPEKDRGIA